MADFRNKMREKYGLQPEEPEKPYKPINNLASYEEQNEPLVKSDSIVTAQVDYFVYFSIH
jgi:hypothetical protein